MGRNKRRDYSYTHERPIDSRQYAQFKPDSFAQLNRTIEEKSKYSEIFGVPAIMVLNALKKAIKIVENTEEYTEYLLFSTFSSRDSYKKVPPGTIRIYSKNLFCFFNGRSWRKLK